MMFDSWKMLKTWVIDEIEHIHKERREYDIQVIEDELLGKLWATENVLIQMDKIEIQQKEFWDKQRIQMAEKSMISVKEYFEK